jgi:hypothetical protein
MRLGKDIRIEVFVQILTVIVLMILPAASRAQQEGVILYFPLAEGLGDVANDASGNGNNGVLSGAPEWTQGKYGSGLYLDGKDDYIEITNILGEEGTIEFWFKPDWDGSDAEDFRLFDAGTGTIYFFISKGANHADINPQDFGFYFEDATDADWQDIEFDPVGVINAGQWHHIAATWKFNGGFAFVYINGEQAATSPNVLGPFPPLNANARFGLEVIEYVPSTNGATGVMDEIVIYNRALTADEITQDMLELGAAVEASGKATSTWGHIKSRYSP